MGIVSDCIEPGLRPRCHFEDITRADFYGFVVPFANRLMEMSEQSGVPIKIRACDTMGFGVPYVPALRCREVYPASSMDCSIMPACHRYDAGVAWP